jgi:hypothetical protein
MSRRTPGSGYPSLPNLVKADLPDVSGLLVDLGSCLEEAIVLSVRLDLTPPILWSDLALFARPTDDSEEPVDNEMSPGGVG